MGAEFEYLKIDRMHKHKAHLHVYKRTPKLIQQIRPTIKEQTYFEGNSGSRGSNNNWKSIDRNQKRNRRHERKSAKSE